ncbi:MAG TPA: tRNA uridine-5-carboxymethylaminomethyl(34) synthesis GTPase MnmE [Candidatus Omnitrophota bacterium]|nr:tRNA uridine-5-carboxymethylaminomethyl(34) synthesis GTPase MnmE [Candidatus Omnitrophota bacterium]HPT38827.1 tRNA uridine-5-carboxymethylaminomethyl(34) synthesis GTPase MnmE [Candidatus Omnitrophota bacterium]
MWEDNLQDTIAAISTANGEGGIGIVRLSGKDSLKVADKIFVGLDKNKPTSFKSYTMHYGKIVDQHKIIDEVILTVMRRPNSYTRQDVVEINCHGGRLALRKILDLVLEQGCRLASPGEFTRRAFLNGRIDLAQAEAVIDIIRAKTDSALKISLGQLNGSLSREINKIRRRLLDILVILEANIDFPEEEIQAQDLEKTSRSLASADAQLNLLLNNASGGRILREGLHVVICGKPNVGKSSLLNALLKKERSIVTPVAGTTRDTIEELMDIKGIPVRIVDTAGILAPRNLIERKAVKLARNEIKAADLVIILFDASHNLDGQDLKLIKEIKHKKTIAVINKIDLKAEIEKKVILSAFSKVVLLAAKSGKNLNHLEDALYDFVYQGKLPNPEFMLVSNLRHIHALRDAQKLINQTRVILSDQPPLELITQNLKDACVYLDKILGKSFSEDLLDRIFSDFCIGK